jgi:glutamate carboxypeptidase
MRTQTLSLAIALALGGVVGPAAAQGKGALSGVERKIVSAVDSHNVEALELLIRTVNINSGTLNFAGVRKVGDLFRA